MPGESSELLVIVDADALIALSSVSDANHEKAKRILRFLSTSHAAALFPTTAICEAVTVLRGRLNKPDDASSIIKKLQSGDFPVQAVDQETLLTAATLYKPLASKKNTLFDAVVAALAKQVHTDAIFSFDGWYRKIGLRLTDDLLATKRDAA
jgi:predicted nucleic acid-binding protein